MMGVEVYLVAVLLAAVAAMAVGFVWYSPAVLGKPWMKLMGHTAKSLEAAKKEMGKTYALSMVGSLVTAYVLAIFTNVMEVSTLSQGAMLGFWMWLGFVAPVQFTDVLFGGKKYQLFYINTGYQLVSLLVMGMVLSAWK